MRYWIQGKLGTTSLNQCIFQAYLIFFNVGAPPQYLGLYKGHQKLRKFMTNSRRRRERGRERDNVPKNQFIHLQVHVAKRVPSPSPGKHTEMVWTPNSGRGKRTLLWTTRARPNPQMIFYGMGSWGVRMGKRSPLIPKLTRIGGLGESSSYSTIQKK